MTRPVLMPIALIATVLLAAGCSSSTTSGNGSGSSVASTPAQTSAAAPSTAAPSTSAPTAAPDLATLPVQPGDLPAGWAAAPASSDAGDAAKQAEMVACVGGKSTAADKVSRAEKDYQQGSTNQITSNAQLMKSQADVTTDTAILHSPKINSCYQQAAQKAISGSLPAGGKLVSVKFSITPGANGGPKNVVAIGHGTATITVSGQTATVYVDVIFITGNRIEGEVDFTGVGARIDSTLEEKIATAVAQRIANA